MLSKKVYVEMAKIIRGSENLAQFVNKFCNYAKFDNPRFNESKFRKAVD